MNAQTDLLLAGCRIADMFHTANTQALWESSTREMQQAFGSPDDLKVLRENLIAQYGTEAAVLSERTETQSGFRVYTRVARWTGTDVPLQLVIAINELDKVAGFWIRPQAVAAYSPHLNYQTKANLCLPVDGEWYVYWGGRTVEDNYHAADQGQRFALDLLVLQNGGSHAGEPKVLANYHCWGRSVVAPAAGVIVHAVDGLKDQTIGASDPTNPAGNHVVIDFGSKEYGFLAHLQRNSIRVSAGDRVARGQEIGLCGNSGNSSEPHLHFHLQTSPVLGQGDGLPAQFLDYRANGVLIGRGEPTRGEMIRSENSPSSPRRRPRP